MMYSTLKLLLLDTFCYGQLILSNRDQMSYNFHTLSPDPFMATHITGV